MHVLGVGFDFSEFVGFTIYGLVAASTYFIAASGLVLTYQTTGVFNLAHGAVGMAAAYVYWQMSVDWGWPVGLSLILTVFVFAPLLGLIFEWGFRQLKDASLATTLVTTVAILAVLLAVVQHIWSNQQGASLPFFFAGDSIKLGTIVVTYQDITTLIISLVVALAIRALMRGARIGVAMRGVVENRDLAALNGVSTTRVSKLAWSMGCSLAALAGILIAPSLGLTTTGLTLLVINAYAAAMVGRLRSLPLTYLGAVILGLAITYTNNYGPRFFAGSTWPAWLTRLPESVPVLMLFVVLLLLPRERLTGWNARVGRSLKIPSLRRSIIASLIVIAVAVAIGAWMPHPNQDVQIWGDPFAFGLIVLSMVPLAGWAGQVSLCQISFAGLGAWVMAEWAATGSPWGLIVALLFVGAVGAVVALPTLRLQGLYLTLSTLAVAVLAEKMFFPQSFAFISNTSVPRVDLGSWLNVQDSRHYLVFVAVAYCLVACILLAIRRGPFGRRLAAMRDSPAACATLGLNTTATKLQVFALSAGIAGLGGALWGGLHVSVTNEQFSMISGLPILLLAVIGGISTVSGAFVGASFFTLLAWLGARYIGLGWFVDLAPAATVLALARHPDGAVVQTLDELAKSRERFAAARGRRRDRRAGAPPIAADATTDDVLSQLDIAMPLGAPLADAEVDALDRWLGIDGARADVTS